MDSKVLVRRFLSDASYSDIQIDEGFAYADAIGWSTPDELGQLALSKILYRESDLADGLLIGWEPEDWEKWSDANDN